MPKRILHLADKLSFLDSTQKSVIEGLSRKGFEIQIAAPPSAAYRADYPFFAIDLFRFFGLGSLISIAQVVKIIKCEKIDMLHVHSRTGAIIGGIAARICKIPFSRSFYNLPFYDGQSKFSLQLNMIVEKMLSNSACCALFFQSRSDLEKMRKLKTCAKLFFQGSGIDICAKLDIEKIQNTRKSLCLSTNDIAIGLFCDKTSNKTKMQFLMAFEKAHKTDSRLVAILHGIDTERPSSADRKLLRRIDLNPLRERILILDNSEDFDIITGACNMVVFSKSRNEPFLHLLEASYAKVPVICYKSNFTLEAIEDGVSGFLYDDSDVDSLFAILQKLAQSALLRKKTSIEANKRILEHFDENQVISRIASAYTLVLESLPYCQEVSEGHKVNV